jgi:phage terminase large subunit
MTQARYNPEFSAKYRSFWNDSRYTILTGGRGSGKSFFTGMFLMALIHEEPGHTILFTRYTLRSASVSIIPEFKEKLELLQLQHLFKITRDEIVNRENGSKIIFRGIKTSSGDQTANLKSLQGVTTWVMEEAEEIDEESFDKIDLSVRSKEKQNRVILLLNPSTKEHFIYKRFYEEKAVQAGANITKGDVTYIHTTYKDNYKNLSSSYIAQIEDMRVRRPERYSAVIEGNWIEKAEGVIFTNWKLGKFKEVGPSVYGADFGFSADSSTLVQTSIDKDNKIIYLKLCFYLQGLTTSQLRELYTKHAGQSLIIADSAEPRLIHELKTTCNIMPSIKGQGSITYGIALLQDYDLVIDDGEGSAPLIKELNNYSWLEKKSQTPIDKFNHALDAIRYSISYQLKNPNQGQYHII